MQQEHIFAAMLKMNAPYSLPRILAFAGIVALLHLQLNAATSVGDDDKKKKKGVVLKVEGFDLSKPGHKLSHYRPGVLYKPSYSYAVNKAVSGDASTIYTQRKGNTVYVIPVKSTTKVPLSKFKVPSKSNN